MYHTIKQRPHRSFLPTITALCLAVGAAGLSNKPVERAPPPPPDPLLDRRSSLIVAGAGAVGAYAAVQLGFSDELVVQYPKAHENRVKAVLRNTLSGARGKGSSSSPLSVLEVGMGPSARLIQRGLYKDALQNVSKLDLTGLDLHVPRDPQKLEQQLTSQGGGTPLVHFRTVQASITERTPFPDHSFDAIVCCLTLCSVDDPYAAVSEMKRLLKPNGGRFGYVEHVAAPDGSFLAFQQQLLDPLQNVLADNCHLHRDTVATVDAVFGKSATKILQQETFYVRDMWPVSCQACGVLEV